MKAFILLILLSPWIASAQLETATIFSDNMVVQRDQPFQIWGKGLPGKMVEVTFNLMTKTSTIAKDSTWVVRFLPATVNRTPQQILITSAGEKVSLRNILIGDLWLCLGQSNMEWPMKQALHYQEELAKSHQPLLRFYNPNYTGKGIFGEKYSDSILQRLNADNLYEGAWQESDSFSFKNMSAIAYHFGKEIIDSTGIPIGLINLAVGGAPIETFIDRAALELNEVSAKKLNGNWLQNDHLPVWARVRGTQNIGTKFEGLQQEALGAHPFKPGFIFEKGIAPIVRLPVKGILWYQGESNAQEEERVYEYGELMKIMVNDFRKHWQQPSLPFYFAQLSSIDTIQYKGALWHMFRDEQRRAMQEIEHSGMAVTSDVGERHDVHPRDKKTPGKRLARWALSNKYNKTIQPSGPLPLRAVFEKDRVTVYFKYTGKKLQVTDGKSLQGFSIDGVKEVKAELQQHTVVIKTNKMPAHIYYGWKSFSDGNLVNEDHLPASTFKIEVHPLDTEVVERPALIPMPRQIRWMNSVFPLYKSKVIVIGDSSLLPNALLLQKELRKRGIYLSIQNRIPSHESFISLSLGKVKTPQSTDEAYKLRVEPRRATLTANTPQGIFYGLQTLLQLTRDAVIASCDITDWPAFSWRGYMIDVGRNYMSMELLRQQIDVMSRYKFNVFHFHFTEDIAWRLVSKKYPQLTLAKYMLRDPGMYYSESDMKELIAYCKERFITLVPEIDMPGHSAAFTRAMGFNMQSDSGLIVVKNIIKEFIETYDLSHFHIGADEVKITNQHFVPEVSSLIQSLGKQVVGWQPGGNFIDNTIRQLWMDDNAHKLNIGNVKYVDSRHLYINHMDPLESVVTIFNRRILDKESGDANALGATLCTWHDRAIAGEGDILQMNPVYPSMLAFAERSWRGGGNVPWTATIGKPDSETSKTFAAFEERLLEHQQNFFGAYPFPYVRQSASVWNLYGPYDNKGLLQTKFEPELNRVNINQKDAVLKTIGGTVVLRHWWYPLIEGVLENPEDSTTWYATTRIWSSHATTKSFWIGFSNLSRSPATDSPPVEAWDAMHSAIWVNEQLIAPPVWRRAGQAGHSEIPLTDEGYEYREPTRIELKKGWNEVLIKVPVSSFKGKDWQNPVKWMFTFAELTR